MLLITEHMDPLDLANYCAKMSCPKWNRSLLEPKTKFFKALKAAIVDKIYSLSRSYYRNKCWAMAQTAWESGERNFWAMYFKDRNDGTVCTYPWPYCDSKFADWPKESGASVYDPSGCEIRDSTSYCAWKIYEKTGHWPNKNENLHLPADSWQYFLQKAGYTYIAEKPTYGHHYVAINPREGEHGMVYWIEGINRHENVIATAYRDQRYVSGIIPKKEIDKYIWIEIT